ncbi:TIGR03619 family F420-dependent LLM class oxidoreductase [Amycolatopsis sp. NPDC005232]|uniref:TIGR03619 family F420-dependent LLM class oxidoreductase n=1 Tax=Amycolatopsis sp. NPDC005232 TaxID=3157027 RepID=UPI0033BCB9D0
MRIGFTLPQFGPFAGDGSGVTRFARRAEELGAASLWVGDRLLAPVHPTVGYGGSDTIPAEFAVRLDPFALLAAAAAVTERVRLGTNVLNAPWYPPALLARSLTTIDALSGGRLVPGLGTGWSPEEYEAVNVPMTERGARLDECLDALEALWTTDPAEYRGRHWTVPETHDSFKPVRTPPVYLAGYAPAAMRRIARRAAGWLPVITPPAEYDPATAILAPLADLRQLAEEAGRDPAELGAILRVYPRAGAGVADVVTVIERTAQDTELRDVFVDLTFTARSTDHALELVETILGQTSHEPA